MRVALLTLAAGCLLVLTVPVAAGGNTAPLADAGVDQTVTVGSTVYLDANGSVDPDGEIAAVSWTITSPDGTTTTPACAECRQTEFEANTTGRYAVDLTVTDDEGATSSDTLYVTVTNATGPDVSLSGPGTSALDSNTTFRANVSAEGASLQSLAWVVNGSVVRRQSLNGTVATHSFTHSFDRRGNVPVRAVAHDVLGRRGSTTHSHVVRSNGGPPNLPCNHSVYEDMGMGFCEGGADKIYDHTDVTYIRDSNGIEGIQLHSDYSHSTYGNSILIDYANVSRSKYINRTGTGSYHVSEEVSISDATAELERDILINGESAFNNSLSKRYENMNANISRNTVLGSDESQDIGLPDDNTKGSDPFGDNTDDGSDNSDDSDDSSMIGGIVDTVTDPFTSGDSGSSDSDDSGDTGDSSDGDSGDGGGGGGSGGVLSNPLF